MEKVRILVRFVVVLVMIPLMTVQPSFAWGREGHMMINRLAGGSAALGCAGVFAVEGSAGCAGILRA